MKPEQEELSNIPIAPKAPILNFQFKNKITISKE
jgi:hypothetical protein